MTEVLQSTVAPAMFECCDCQCSGAQVRNFSHQELAQFPTIQSMSQLEAFEFEQ